MNSAVRDFQELYQAKLAIAGNGSASGFVNSAVIHWIRVSGVSEEDIIRVRLY